MLRRYQNKMDTTILNLGGLLLMVLIGKNIASASHVITDPEQFVLRDTRGELRCTFDYTKQVSSVTWLKGPTYEGAKEVVKYFMGVTIGPKYDKGYDLADDNSTLIIENVKDEDEGTWWCNVIVTDPWTDRGSTNVTVTIPPTPPTISQCPTGKPCEIEVEKGDTNYTVTCTAIGSRSAVTLILYQDDQKLDADPQHRKNPDDPSTYDTILEIPVNLDSDKDEFVITCEAVGHHSLPESEKRAQKILKIQRDQTDPTMSKRKDDDTEVDPVKIGIYAGVGVVVIIALIIGIVIAGFVVSSKMQPNRTRYRGAKKKKKGRNRPRCPSPPPSPEEGRTTLSSIQSELGLNDNGQSDSEKHDYENLPKGIRNGLCSKSPVYQSPVSAC